MKINYIVLLVVFAIIFGNNIFGQKNCTLKTIYQKIEPDYETKVITSSGGIETAEALLVPMNLEIGKYKIRISKKYNNIYKIDGQDIYLETRYCFKYPISEEVILSIESNYGYEKGSIIFFD